MQMNVSVAMLRYPAKFGGTGWVARKLVPPRRNSNSPGR